MDLTSGTWLNPPARHEVSADRVSLTTDRATDFWRHTHYGFVRDSGHMLGFPAPGAFTLQARIRGRYHTLYDQAGLMLRAGPEHWVKAGVELSDGALRLSVVVTDGWSDWSLGASPDGLEDVWLRLTLRDGALRVQASTDGRVWPLLRLGAFRAAGPLLAGPMACTPEREGLEVEVSDLTLGPPRTNDLHDLG